MVESVIDFIQSEQLILPGDKVAVALSGGADSMAVLHLLMALRPSWSLELSAIHIHHGLRKASDQEATFVQDFCRKNEVALFTQEVDLGPRISQGMSVEMAAREARYDVFQAYATNHQCSIALGHHMDDQAETVLLNLLRGSGIRGLKGMLPRRGVYIRPLLKVDKETILAYCQENDLHFVTDESNDDLIYRRNYLRHDVLPSLEEKVQPQLIAHLNQTAEILREEDAYMGAIADELMEPIVKKNGTRIVIDLSKLNEQAKVMKRRIYRKALELCIQDLRNVNYRHIEQMLNLGDGCHTGKCCHLPDGWQYRINYNEGILEQRDEAITREQTIYEVDIRTLLAEEHRQVGPFEFKVLKGQNALSFPKGVYTKWFDYDKIESNLVLRTRAPGDFIHLGREGFRKKLKDYFIDEKVARAERNQIPLITLGQEVVWVVGYRMNETYKVSETTRTILAVVYNKEALQ